MEITSPNLDGLHGSTNYNPLNTNRIKFEVQRYAQEPKIKKPSFLSRIFGFLSGFGPLGLALAPFTGGLSLLGTAAASGFGHMAAKSQQTTLAANQASIQSLGPQVMSYPGFMPTGGISPAVFSSDPVLDLVSTSRDAAFSSSTKKVGG